MESLKVVYFTVIYQAHMYSLNMQPFTKNRILN